MLSTLRTASRAHLSRVPASVHLAAIRATTRRTWRMDEIRTIGRRAFAHWTGASFGPATSEDPAMFCFQCEQTENGTGCTTIGVCGKTPEAAAVQDLIVHATRGISEVVAASGGEPSAEVNHLVLEALFSTLTNVNFDVDALTKYASDLVKARDALRASLPADKAAALGEHATFKLLGEDAGSMILQGSTVGVKSRRKTLDQDVLSLQELITYGIKGMAAYAHHAWAVGRQDKAITDSIYKAFAYINQPVEKQSVSELVGLALEVGGANVRTMEILNEGHKARFGVPEPTQVSTVPEPGKCILVSGHDINDLEALLRMTEGKGINVYTHGELLPAHAYPLVKKYSHLKGNYGGAWQVQKTEFADFPGPVLVTTNCLIEPRASYRDRLFTTNAVGWEGIRHVANHDFGPIIEAALASEGFDADDVEEIKAETKEHYTMTGFGHDAVLGVADKIIGAIDAGALRHIFLVGGCDGSEGERSYYTDFALQAPRDTAILTLGCGKYRFNKHFEEMGFLGDSGIPRMLDMGQCNDAYSAVRVALALAEHYKTDVNQLPLSLVISWFEQKAVAVFLSLLHLGVKNIRLGPTLPAFVSPNVLDVIVQNFNVSPLAADAKTDLEAILGAGAVHVE